MKHSALLVASFTLAGCPNPDDGNPDVLWLALDGRETEVKLSDRQPSPF
jgi:hypothetical protein